MTPARLATVFTHRRPSETGPAIEALLTLAGEAETSKHRLQPRPGLELDAPVRRDVDVCFALGGDGTILHALRTYAGTGVPVFAVNYGEIGFLATVERDQTDDGFRRAFLTEVAGLAGRDFTVAPGTDFAAARQARLDTLGDLVADHLDTEALGRLIEHGPPAGLPVIPPAGGLR